MSLGITEIVLILTAILILFGGRRIPELAKAFGRASYEYKKAKEAFKIEMDELKQTTQKAIAIEEEKARTAALPQTRKKTPRKNVRKSAKKSK